MLNNNLAATNANLATISHTGFLEPGNITDFNSATTAGLYRVALEFAAGAHPPYVATGSPAYGLLEVKVAPFTSWIWQIYHVTNSSDRYIRQKTNDGAWTAWVLK